MHVLKEQRKKLNDKSMPCVFVGYGYHEYGYRLWGPCKRTIKRHKNVIFYENQTLTEDDSDRIDTEKIPVDDE